MKSVLSLSVLGGALILSSLAYAEKPAESPACAGIVKSCESAGFKPGDHKKTGKGLWVDCVHQIAMGKTVEGVTATQDEAKACAETKKGAKKH